MAEARVKRVLSPEAKLKAAERGRAALERYRKVNQQGVNYPQIGSVPVR
jgi:hypothetical protein